MTLPSNGEAIKGRLTHRCVSCGAAAPQRQLPALSRARSSWMTPNTITPSIWPKQRTLRQLPPPEFFATTPPERPAGARFHHQRTSLGSQRPDGPPRNKLARRGPLPAADREPLAKPELVRNFHDKALRSLPGKRAAKIAAPTLALPDARASRFSPRC